MLVGGVPGGVAAHARAGPDEADVQAPLRAQRAVGPEPLVGHLDVAARQGPGVDLGAGEEHGPDGPAVTPEPDEPAPRLRKPIG